MDLSELPVELHDILTEAEAKIGAVRAVIALQGVVYRFHSIRFIDGSLSDETISAANVVSIKIGRQRLAELVREHVTGRFPTEFAPQPEDVTKTAVTLKEWSGEDTAVIADGNIAADVEIVMTPKTRRRK